MQVYWDADWSAWIAMDHDGTEIMLSADSESQAQLSADILSEGTLYDE